MNQKLSITAVMVAILLVGCSIAGQPEPTPWPETVDWETAVEILQSGKVVAVSQLHNLSVTLEMDDGSLIETVEPVIDEIFREIELCGSPCEGILLATE
jgi:hypothetical protein